MSDNPTATRRLNADLRSWELRVIIIIINALVDNIIVIVVWLVHQVCW